MYVHVIYRSDLYTDSRAQKRAQKRHHFRNKKKHSVAVRRTSRYHPQTMLHVDQPLPLVPSSAADAGIIDESTCCNNRMSVHNNINGNNVVKASLSNCDDKTKPLWNITLGSALDYSDKVANNRLS